jgi:hypothetical protein
MIERYKGGTGFLAAGKENQLSLILERVRHGSALSREFEFLN